MNEYRHTMRTGRWTNPIILYSIAHFKWENLQIGKWKRKEGRVKVSCWEKKRNMGREWMSWINFFFGREEMNIQKMLKFFFLWCLKDPKTLEHNVTSREVFLDFFFETVRHVWYVAAIQILQLSSWNPHQLSESFLW